MKLKHVITIFFVVFLFTMSFSDAFCKQQAEAGNTPWYKDLIFRDESFVFEFIRVIGLAGCGGADFGESVATVKRIKDSDEESWYDEWLATADHVFAFAQDCENKGHYHSASEAYLRASCYYRSAGFYMDAPENRHKSIQAWMKSRNSFLLAAKDMPFVKPVRIPYGNTTMPGYFIMADTTKKKAPLLIAHTGFDGTGEEMVITFARAARSRGYNLLVFEGPGQGEMLRVQNIPFRYDWENVVTPVVDFAMTQPGVDTKRIALMGISFGGYLAPRAAAFEHRIKACIANGGIYDFGEGVWDKMPKDLVFLADKDPEKFNQVMFEVMKESTTIRWALNHGMWVFGKDNPAGYFKEVRKYTLAGVAEKIKCTTLVVDSSNDMFFPGQAVKLYNALTCSKSFYEFTGDYAADLHCQVGAVAYSNAVIFNWLDDILK